jgi:tripartite-type tricarboxylate transporter receptor subunit TctC
VIENRPGAGTNIGTEAVVNAVPDGYTLLLATNPNAVNATLYEKLNFNFIRDIAPIAMVSRVPNVMEVHPSFPATTIGDFVAYAKAHPGQINFASAGIGASGHMAGEMFKAMTGIDRDRLDGRGFGTAIN